MNQNTTTVSDDELIARLNNIWSDDDHDRGCRGREYDCTCGFDERTFATAKEAAARLRSHSESKREWLPIETAPKDGTPFLTFSQDAFDDPQESALGIKGSPVMSMAWVMGEPQPIDECGDWHSINNWFPTHWMPLPAAPARARAVIAKEAGHAE